jgi:hypothetical protein
VIRRHRVQQARAILPGEFDFAASREIQPGRAIPERFVASHRNDKYLKYADIATTIKPEIAMLSAVRLRFAWLDARTEYRIAEAAMWSTSSILIPNHIW